MSTHDPFRYDDAAYVLGALSESDRAAFEQHLRDCAECTARVRELDGIPAALAGIPIDLIAGTDSADNAEDIPMPDTLLPGLLRRARTERRRRIWTTAIGGSAAAAAIVALTVALVLPGHHSSGPAPRAMTALTSTPVSATAVVDAHDWGTSITLACRYTSAYPSGTAYQLVVIDKTGAPHDAGSWTLESGDVTHFTGGTWIPRAQIAKIEVEPSNGAPILSLSL